MYLSKKIVGLGIPLLLASCSSTPTTTPLFTPGIEVRGETKLLPEHIRKIAVPTFKNLTTIYGLEERLTYTVRQQFLQDGRLELVDESQADGLLHGELNRYILEPLRYDANYVIQEYKLWVITNVNFYEKDIDTGQWKDFPLWEEKNLEGVYRFTIATLPGGITEEEARTILWDRLARDIVIRTIRGFGSISGASERKIPQ